MSRHTNLIFGVALNGVKHPLRFKVHFDDEALVKNICDWLPIIILRAKSGGVNAGYEVSTLPKHQVGTHIAYWYDSSMYYYVEVSEVTPDFVPSPAIAAFYDELDQAPVTLSAAQAFNNLWAAVQQTRYEEHSRRIMEDEAYQRYVAAELKHQRRRQILRR